jgi:hypothetical protein
MKDSQYLQVSEFVSLLSFCRSLGAQDIFYNGSKLKSKLMVLAPFSSPKTAGLS